MFKIIGFLSIIGLIFWILFSLLGSSGLLILKHDVPKDSHFVRNFFNFLYKVLIIIASLAALSLTLAENYFLAISMLCVAAFGISGLLIIVARMDRLSNTVTISDKETIRKFRFIHITGIALNLSCLIALFWVLGQSTLFTCNQIPPGCIIGQPIVGQTEPCKHICSLF